MSSVFSCETRRAFRAEERQVVPVKQQQREITCKTVMRLRLSNWIPRNERESKPRDRARIDPLTFFQHRPVRRVSASARHFSFLFLNSCKPVFLSASFFRPIAITNWRDGCTNCEKICQRAGSSPPLNIRGRAR